MIPRLGLLALAALAIGCSPTFRALTTPPITRTARLDSHADTIEISPGVALAFECEAAGSYDPCEGATATVDDPRIAGVLPAYVDEVSERWWTVHGPAPVSSFVVYGVAPGKTAIRVRSKNGDAVLAVTVVDERPEPAPPKLLQAISH